MVSMESCEKFACDYIRRFPLRFLWSEIEQQKFSDHTETEISVPAVEFTAVLIKKYSVSGSPL
jgi:hypothetical protein